MIREIQVRGEAEYLVAEKALDNDGYTWAYNVWGGAVYTNGNEYVMIVIKH